MKETKTDDNIQDVGAAADKSDKSTLTKGRIDPYIWGTYILLLIVAIVELFSASSQEVRVDDIYGPIIRHVTFLGIGLVIMLVLQRIHFVRLYYFIPAYVLLSFVMMVLVLICGTRVNGAMRGLELGGFLILPAEFLKLAVALGIAWILSRTQDPNKHDVTNGGVITCAILVLIGSGLLIEHGLTNTLMLMAISLSMMIAGGIGWRKIGITLCIYMALGGAYFVYKYATTSNEPISEEQVQLAQINKEDATVQSNHNRMYTWTDRLSSYFEEDKYTTPITDDNKQEQLSYIAQARGGITGVGIGNSRESARLPLAFSDYIFAIVVEELGVVVAIFVIILYLFLLGRAFKLAYEFKQTFPCLMVMGCALVICLQALFHICIVVGVFPVSGQPLPLISKGGTSVIATSLAFGIMLSASRWAPRRGDDDAVNQQGVNNLPDDITKTNLMQQQ